MQKRFLLIATIVALMFIACSPQREPFQTFTTNQYVNLFMGSASHPDVFPGPMVPQGNIAVVPITEEISQPAVYRFGSPSMYGFLHKFGEKNHGLRVMSVFGDQEPITLERKSAYSFESAEPGFYRTQLDTYATFAEMTVTQHTSLSQFRYQDGWAHIFIEPSMFGQPSSLGKLIIANPFEIEGFTLLENDEKLYFVARFNRSAMGGGFYRDNRLVPENLDELEGENIGVYFSFRTLEAGEVLLKIGLSRESIVDARSRIDTEQTGWAFALVRNQAREAWEQVLSNIRVYSQTEDSRTLFYTALYRALGSTSHSKIGTWNTAPALFDQLTSAYCADGSDFLLLQHSENLGMVIGQFSNNPAGLPARGPLATVSSRLVFAMLGLAPQCAEPEAFQVGVPFFERIELTMGDEKAESFIILTSKQPQRTSVIQSVSLNNTRVEKVIQRESLKGNGRLNIKLKN